MAPYIVGIRFQKVGKIYHFNASKSPDLKIGDFVIVDTSRGRQLGEVVDVLEEVSTRKGGHWKPILRRATPRDLVIRQILQKKELEATINCRAKVAELGIQGVKIVTSEFTFDGARLSILYSSETEGKVDLKKLRGAMQRTYHNSRVDMRQVGPRDVAKIIGGMGACGMDTRCCSMFLSEFSPISIKMAKAQGISLTPSEITGMCGRLRCCLIYEYELYVNAKKSLPRRGKRVVTPLGEGRVIDVYPLKMSALVEIENGLRQEFTQDQIEPWHELQALKQKAQEPCSKHEGGECDCGKSEQPKQGSNRSRKKKRRSRK